MQDREPIVVELWGPIFEPFSKLDPVELPAGTVLYRGARFAKGEREYYRGNWSWGDHWYTKREDLARHYSRPIPEDLFYEGALLTLETLRPLTLLNLDNLNMAYDVCLPAIEHYSGMGIMGNGDYPLKRHLKKTMKHFFGDRYQGYSSDDEIFIFDRFHNLVEIAEPELVFTGIEPPID